MSDEQKYAIVRVGGELTWVTAEQMNDYNERMRDLKGDWSWEQEMGLAALRKERERHYPIRSNAEAHRVVMGLITHLNELNKQDVGSIRDKPGTKMVRIDGSYPIASQEDVERCRKHIPPRPFGITILPPPPSHLTKLRIKRGRWGLVMVVLCLIAFTNAFAPWTLSNLEQWADFICWTNLAALAIYRSKALTKQINEVEAARSPVTYTPLPSSVTGYVRDKPRSEQYADKYVETGNLMYKFLMEDAYAEEHRHDFDIKELP